MSDTQARFPHCDDLVLHAPGKCVYCDSYPHRQAERLKRGIAFTGQSPIPGLLRPCPSTERRPLETIEKWSGNRPQATSTATTNSANPKMTATSRLYKFRDLNEQEREHIDELRGKRVWFQYEQDGSTFMGTVTLVCSYSTIDPCLIVECEDLKERHVRPYGASFFHIIKEEPVQPATVDNKDLVGPLPLQDEEYREYDFNGREKPYRIDAPKQLFYRNGGTTHRVVDSQGVIHCVPAPGEHGCVLRWKTWNRSNPVQF